MITVVIKFPLLAVPDELDEAALLVMIWLVLETGLLEENVDEAVKLSTIEVDGLSEALEKITALAG